MNIQKIKLVYFSPTKTTKNVIQSIARGINHSCVEMLDVTRPETRQEILNTNENELLIVGVPVYMGRVPATISRWLRTIKAQNTPAVCVVVYGNRAYDDALLELKNILTEGGCKAVAGGAFIGEHSFSSAELPSSVGRPDPNDISYAEIFGQKINELLKKVSSIRQLPGLYVPGNFPYGGITELWHIDFIAVDDQCTQCGICAEGCPVGAIDPYQSNIIDKDKCILCCACIKHCPQNARSMKEGLMKEAAVRCTKFIERKEPEYFF